MPDIEHPDIKRTLKTGYPNMVNLPEHYGIDLLGCEVLVGDSIIETPDCEIVLEQNLKEYLTGIGFVFKTAD